MPTCCAGSQKRNSKGRPKSPHRVPLLLKPQLSSDSYDSQSSRATSTASQSEVGHFERPLSQSSQQSFNVSPNRTSSSSHTTSPLISSRVPPPANILAPATRTKDGFFVVENRNSGHSETGDHESRDSAGEKTSDKSKESPSKSREFVVRDGALQRSKPGRNVIKIPKSKLTNEKKAEKSQPGLSSKFLAMRSTPINNLSTAGNFESNMKRSFRYRMITLRPEKPIFVDNGEENSESEDEGEEASGATKARRKRHVSLTRKAPVNNKSKLLYSDVSALFSSRVLQTVIYMCISFSIMHLATCYQCGNLSLSLLCYDGLVILLCMQVHIRHPRDKPSRPKLTHQCRVRRNSWTRTLLKCPLDQHLYQDKVANLEQMATRECK